MSYSSKQTGNKAFYLIGFIVLLILQFIMHRLIPFMMDDLWYSTNLATKQPLTGILDVIESQIWHFHHWGGRNITHGLLQLILMEGELFADVCNILVTIALAFLICKLAGTRGSYYLFLASSLVILLNANVKMSMYWESGSVNYLYSTTWILLFLLAYVRQDLPGTAVWIVPIAVMTGWSNENMGPTCLILALMMMAYNRFKKKGIKPWMIYGAILCFIGNLFVILAPGNFVRKDAIEYSGLGEMLWERFLSMLTAGASFLLPTIMLLLAVAVVYRYVLKKEWTFKMLWLVIGMVLSYGAMMLSPHYPDRATFGTMVLGIVCILEMIGKAGKEEGKAERSLRVFAVTAFAGACYVMLYELAILCGMI